MPLRHTKPNIVQSIRAWRVQDLQDAATELGHHFLYASIGEAQSKQDVLDMLAVQLNLPSHFIHMECDLADGFPCSLRHAVDF